MFKMEKVLSALCIYKHIKCSKQIQGISDRSNFLFMFYKI